MAKFETEFESGLPGFDATITRCVVSEVAGRVTQWDEVINVNAASPWFINLEWSLEGPSRPFMAGQWDVQAFFESIGPGPVPAPVGVSVAYAGEAVCTAALQIPGGTIPVPLGATSPYKVVVTLTFHSLNDIPAQMAGYAELPVLEFYNAP